MTVMDYAKKTITNKKKNTRHVRSVGSVSLARKANKTRARKTKSTSLLFNLFNLVNLVSPMFIMVLVVGLLFVGAIFYAEIDLNKFSKKLENIKLAKHALKPEPLKKPESSKPAIKPNKTITANKTPKFEFYHTLPKMSVDIGDSTKTLDKKTELVVAETIRPIPVIPVITPANPVIKNSITSKKEDNSVVIASSKVENNAVRSSAPSSVRGSGSQYVLQIASFRDRKDAEELRAKLILQGFDVTIQTVKLSSGVVWHRVKSNSLSNMQMAMSLHTKFKSRNIDSIILSERGVVS